MRSRKASMVSITGKALCIGYGRGSNIGIDIATQKAKCQLRSQELGFELLWLEEREHRDTKVRPVKEAVLEAIRAGRVKTLIVYDTDRIIYGAGEFEQLWNLCRERGTRFIAMKTAVDTDSPYSEIIGTLGAMFAKMELMKIRERTKDKMGELKGKIPLGGQMHKGHRWVSKETKEKAPLIKTLAEAGHGAKKIAANMKIRWQSVKYVIETPMDKIETKRELYDRLGIYPGRFSLKNPQPAPAK
jgi:DNA invertase Pin-like site-specific DNA recombinase